MLSTKSLTYSYDNKTVLNFPDLECPAGQNLLILGQSGCGKTTLLHLLGGLLRPSSGTIQLGERAIDITELGNRALDEIRGKEIGIIFQTPHFVEALTVEENLILAQSMAGQKTDKNRAKELLDQLNLGHKLKSSTRNLSQGEKQRVSIARALMNKPSLILADEPTSALDDKNCEEVLNLLQSTAKAHHATLLIVTHDNRLQGRTSHKIVLK